MLLLFYTHYAEIPIFRLHARLRLVWHHSPHVNKGSSVFCHNEVMWHLPSEDPIQLSTSCYPCDSLQVSQQNMNEGE